MAAGDLSGPIVSAVGDIKTESAAVAAAALALGAVLYGTKRLWGFFKGIR